ncbi:MAG: type II secretion system secretin GspD [Spongiibacteraceae bacterium]
MNLPVGVRRLLKAGLLALLLTPLLLTAPTAWSEQTWTVNFKDAELEELVRFVAQATDKTIIVDPKTKGRVQVVSSKPLNREQLYDLFLSILDVNGFAAVESGDVIKIIPSRDARSAGAPVVSGNTQRENSEIVTEVIQLNNVSASALIPVLRPLAPQQAHMAAYGPSNAIIVSDTANNIARIREVIRQLDRSAIENTDVLKLQNASAEELVRMLQQLDKTDAAQGQPEGKKLTIVADKRTNSLLINGDEIQRARIRALAAHLDGPLAQSGNAKVIYLQYANAKDMAEVLNKVLQNVVAGGSGSQAAAPVAGKAKASVEADEGTNALVITAEPDVMTSMQAVIERLDIRRAQVLVEAIIVEMSDDDARDLGIQWMFLNSSGAYGSSSLEGGLNARTSGAGAGVDGDGNAVDPRIGLGAILGNTPGQIFGLGRVTDNLSFNVVVNALQQNKAANILSTPSLLTLDNEEASIVVGQNVPFLTGSYSSTGSGGSSGVSNPFQTIERENVGLTLKVTPHINEGDSLVLEIEQEVSSLTGAAATVNASDVITNERKIQSKVLADNGQTIVLGGLIKDDVQEVEQKVPLLGDIPVIGNLFRSTSVKKTKTNLMVFLRPVIVRDGRTLTGATGEKYRYIRDEQLYRTKPEADYFGRDKTPLLPEWEKQLEQLKAIQQSRSDVLNLQVPAAEKSAAPATSAPGAAQ